MTSKSGNFFFENVVPLVIERNISRSGSNILLVLWCKVYLEVSDTRIQGKQYVYISSFSLKELVHGTGGRSADIGLGQYIFKKSEWS